MLLTRETSRARWTILGAAWALAALFILLHTFAMREYVALLDRAGRRGAAELTTPLQRPIPSNFADTHAWVRHALTLLETEAWRVRYTDIDNAPFGRPVHWCSGFAWLIAAEGWLRHVVTGEPIPLAVERALAWFNVPLLLGCIAFFSYWTTRRAGAAAGAFVALAMVGNTEFYSGFAPNFADHHGVLAAANFGLVLGAVFMGAGWWRTGGDEFSLLPRSRADARSGAIFSALSGAAGLWVSSASVVPGVAITGVAAVAALLWGGRALRREGAHFDPGLWRLWGRLGGGASLLFYLLEYAPAFAWRLEVNHPLYALAWWGGSELVAAIGEWRLGLRGPRASLARIALGFAAAASPAVAIAIGGAKVFIIRDPTILQISARVSEGVSLWKGIEVSGSWIAWVRVPWAAACLGPALYLIVRRRNAEALLIAFAAGVSVAFLALGLFQIRFFANTAGPEVCLLLILMASVRERRAERLAVGAIIVGVTVFEIALLSRTALYSVCVAVLGVAAMALAWKVTSRAWIAGAAIAALCLPERVQGVINAWQTVRIHGVARLDVLQPVYRDIAARLRADQPEGDIILLTNPDASSAIGYFGRLKTIGTLYWENLAGMKAAAAMHAALSVAEARELLAARRVTHVAVISESSFVPEFFQLARPEANPADWPASFAYQLFERKNLPLWAEELPYEPPEDATLPDLRVVIYRTHFAAPAAEELFAAARREALAGRFAASQARLERALAISGDAAEFWVLKAELALAQGATADAAQAAQTALRLMPAVRRPGFAVTLGGAFYGRQRHRETAELYRIGLEANYDPALATNLAWLLATSPDDAVRDGAAALNLAQRVVRESPNSPLGFSAFAAALAETGRFDDAVAAATRALELTRTAGDARALAGAETRLQSYRAGRRWRQ